MDKREALRTLDSELTEILLSSEKAITLLGDLTVEYFGTTPKNHDENLLKLYDFKRYSIISGIIFDYVCKIKKIVESLEKENAPQSETPQSITI
jgi:hypothetical protein